MAHSEDQPQIRLPTQKTHLIPEARSTWVGQSRVQYGLSMWENLVPNPRTKKKKIVRESGLVESRHLELSYLYASLAFYFVDLILFNFNIYNSKAKAQS